MILKGCLELLTGYGNGIITIVTTGFICIMYKKNLDKGFECNSQLTDRAKGTECSMIIFYFLFNTLSIMNYICARKCEKSSPMHAWMTDCTQKDKMMAGYDLHDPVPYYPPMQSSNAVPVFFVNARVCPTKRHAHLCYCFLAPHYQSL